MRLHVFLREQTFSFCTFTGQAGNREVAPLVLYLEINFRCELPELQLRFRTWLAGFMNLQAQDVQQSLLRGFEEFVQTSLRTRAQIIFWRFGWKSSEARAGLQQLLQFDSLLRTFSTIPECGELFR